MVQMETDSPVVYHGTSESRFPPEEVKRSQIQLTSEELRVLRDCNRESFYYRCLPFAMAGMAATFYAVKRGILTGHPRWGPSIKMSAAAFAGWFLGKFSYRSVCEEKFLHLENSTIGKAIRKKRGYTLESFQSESDSLLKDDDITLKDNYTSYSGDFHSSSGSLNFDRNIPYSELDDIDRPSVDRINENASEQSQPTRQLTNYDELRRKNREDYERQYRQPEVPRSRSWGPVSSEQQRRLNVDPSRENVPKNEYGDSWDNPKFS